MNQLVSVTPTTSNEILNAVIAGGVQNPFPLYEQLRELGNGVHWSELLNGWFLTRAEDSRAMLSDPESFSNDMLEVTGAGIHNPDDLRQRRFADIQSKFLFFVDPPRHPVIRSIFRSAFTPGAIAGWRPVVERITDELLAGFSAGDEVDFMEELAGIVPVEVIATVLGVPEEDHVRFRGWSEALVRANNPAVQGPDRDEAIATSMELVDYMSAIAEQRKADPQDDLISTVVNTPTRDGDPLDTTEALAQLVVLLAAGNETTSNLLGNGITILLDYPQVKRRLIADPSLMKSAVEEMLRYDPPFHLDFRKAVKDTAISGTAIAAGTPVYSLLPAANRDPRAFDNPLDFDIERKNNRHLAFSHGIHFCVGAPLARLEGEVVFAKLLQKFPDIDRGTAEPVRRTANIISRGWEKRPVRL
ncbi:cytochrome P450 [Nocardia sp. NPDC050378]|uniref:cytochrome P450 n=1 Tax=Nocardia sp. NPDC050378 TaxID=3155400 RepID=UPI0033FAE311